MNFTEIPDKIEENYCNIEPLEPLPALPSGVLKGYITSTYKASHVKTGINYFLRRVHGMNKIIMTVLYYLIFLAWFLTEEIFT